jgi:hypothetical protein
VKGTEGCQRRTSPWRTTVTIWISLWIAVEKTLVAKLVVGTVETETMLRKSFRHLHSFVIRVLTRLLSSVSHIHPLSTQSFLCFVAALRWPSLYARRGCTFPSLSRPSGMHPHVRPILLRVIITCCYYTIYHDLHNSRFMHCYVALCE